MAKTNNEQVGIVWDDEGEGEDSLVAAGAILGVGSKYRYWVEVEAEGDLLALVVDLVQEDTLTTGRRFAGFASIDEAKTYAEIYEWSTFHWAANEEAE